MKRCSKCKEDKLLDAFANASNRVDGKQDCCRSCMSTIRKTHRQRLKDNPPSVPLTKYCPTCKQVKQSHEFYPSVSKSSGLQDSCKTCQVGRSQIYLNDHPEQRDTANTKYREANPERVKNWDRNAKVKRHRLLRDTEFDPTISLDALYHRGNETCGICHEHCERADASIDHIHPLSKGGSHTWNNIQLAHLKCNSRKKDKILTSPSLSVSP